MTKSHLLWNLFNLGVWRAKVEKTGYTSYDIYVPKRNISKVRERFNEISPVAISFNVKELHGVLKFKKYNYISE